MRVHSHVQIVSTFVLAILLAAACAKGTPRGSADGPAGDAGDGGVATVDTGHVSWPDGGSLDGFGGWPDLSPQQPDGGAADAGQTGLDAGSDASQPCTDPSEPNNTCTVAKSIGSTKEGKSWLSKARPLDPASDVDWYLVKGIEGSHFCVPFSSQCYRMKVRLKVPSSRKLRVCIWSSSCTGSPTCKDNQGTTAPTTIETSYKVNGTCTLNDDTTAYIRVDNRGSSGGCSNYTVEVNYDGC